MLIQLELFDKKTEIDLLQDEIKEMRKSQDKVRKSLFAKHGELANKYLEIYNKLEIIEKNICKGS